MKPTRLRVLHIITGLGDGGAEATLFRLITADVRNQHVVISLTDRGKYGWALEQHGVPVYCIGMKPGRPRPLSFLTLWRTIQTIKPGLVQTWMYHADLLGGLAARLAGIKAVCWGIRHSNLAPGTVKRSTIWVARACAALSGCVPSRIVSCAAEAGVAHQRLGYPADKMVTIPNGYDLQKFMPDDAARTRLRQEWRATGKFVVGMVARFDPQKDHANLLDALAMLGRERSDFVAVLVGTDIDAHNAMLVQALASRGLSEQVRLLGRREDVPQVMSALDVHVLSSLGEAFPNVLAEAMACGTPCVSTRVGDAPVIVGETGWLVPPRDAAALAQALNAARQSCLDGAGWKQRQRQCRQHIEQNFRVQTMVERYTNTWLEVAST